jgi:membrane fusion protein, multidrug efflux system
MSRSVSVLNRGSSTKSQPAPAPASAMESTAGEDESAVVATHREPVAKPPNKRKLVTGSVALAVVLAGGGYWYSQRQIESTDDAQIDADLVAVPARVAGTVQAVRFEENQEVSTGQLLAELDDAPARARLAQADANLAAAQAAAHAADVQAQLAQTNAKSGLAMASAGLRTSSVGAESTLAAIAESDARVQNAAARLAEADLNFARSEGLFREGAVSSSQLDQLRTAQEVARTELARAQASLASVKLSRDQAQSRVVEAQAKLTQSSQVDALIREAAARAEQAHAAVETAKAQRTLAELDLSYTKVYAPLSGVVSKKSINVGQNVSVGQGVVQVVPSKRWVTANFKETQLDRMHAGQPVKVKVDAYPNHDLVGTLQSFSGATGSRFALLPPDNATGNFTKVVQRVSVRVQLDNVPANMPLRPGMSVEVAVDTAQTQPKVAHAPSRVANGG